MKYPKILTLALSSLSLLPLCAQTQVAPYRPGLTPEGITYFLPKTSVRIVLEVEHTHTEPGEYARYAERYLRLKDVAIQPTDKWTITSARLETYGQPDPKQAYTIRLNPKSAAPLVGLTDDGRLLSVNAERRDTTRLTQPTNPRIVSGPAVNAAEYKTQEILAAGSTLKMAELAAAEIFDIRENRGLLAKGQADFMPKDGEQLKLMLKSLDEQEQALLSLFTGTTTKDVRTLALDFTPNSATDASLLFRFSQHNGLVDKDDLAGEPYYITIKSLQNLPAQESSADHKKTKEPQDDLRYIVPGSAQIILHDRQGNILTSLTTPLSQLGHVEHLGGELFNKRFTTRVFLSPTTGAILKIEGEAK